MAQVLRFNNTDQRITYNDDWKMIPNSGVGQNGTRSYSSTFGAQFFFLFRGIVHTEWPTRYFFSPSWSLIRLSPPGTSVRFYGRIGGGGGSLEFRLDVNSTTVSLNGTNFDDGPNLVWNADNLGDGDHQLLVYVNSLRQNGSVAVDYFEYAVPLLHFVTRSVFQQEFYFQA